MVALRIILHTLLKYNPSAVAVDRPPVKSAITRSEFGYKGHIPKFLLVPCTSNYSSHIAATWTPV